MSFSRVLQYKVQQAPGLFHTEKFPQKQHRSCSLRYILTQVALETRRVHLGAISVSTLLKATNKCIFNCYVHVTNKIKNWKNNIVTLWP